MPIFRCYGGIWEMLKRKHPETRLDALLLHNENAPGHLTSWKSVLLVSTCLTTTRTTAVLARSDLAPVDFRVFPEIKVVLLGLRFNSVSRDIIGPFR